MKGPKMPEDIRTLLRTADVLVREGRYAAANAIYERVAAEYQRLGFALKAIAVAKQVVSICDAHRLTPSIAALRILAEAYAALGFDAEAEEARKRLAEVHPPS